MFITRKHISRRTFLRGSVGVTLALPFLDAMVPAQTPLAKTAARPLQRFGFIYVPHGSIMKDWTPAQAGTGFEFSPILKPMERFRDQLNVFTGLTNNGENGHSPSTAMWLSGTFPSKGSVIHLGTTVDQIIAAKVGQDTTFPSMEFATEDHSSHLGSCAGDFLCSYMSTISWRTPTQPLPMEINPRVVFERMFGGDGATPAARQARLAQNTQHPRRGQRKRDRSAARPRSRRIAPSSASTWRTCGKSSGGSSRPSASAPITCSTRRRCRSACRSTGKNTSS